MKKLETAINSEDILIAIIDGKDCSTISNFYKIIAEQLQFPDYFSSNLDSFDELISDLSWLNKQRIIIVITNFEFFLDTESPHTINIIKQIFDHAAIDNELTSFEWYYK